MGAETISTSAGTTPASASPPAQEKSILKDAQETIRPSEKEPKTTAEWESKNVNDKAEDVTDVAAEQLQENVKCSTEKEMNEKTTVTNEHLNMATELTNKMYNETSPPHNTSNDKYMESIGSVLQS